MVPWKIFAILRNLFLAPSVICFGWNGVGPPPELGTAHLSGGGSRTNQYLRMKIKVQWSPLESFTPPIPTLHCAEFSKGAETANTATDSDAVILTFPGPAREFCVDWPSAQ